MSSTATNTLDGHLFGHWHFNANTGDLSGGETTTRLEPQVAKLLEYFLDHQNTLTSRDELIAAVWENRIVSDDAINRCVSILRQILSPDDKNAYIETVVRRGFISHFPAPPTGKPLLGLHAKRKNRLILLALAGLSAILFYSAFERFNDSPAEVQSPRRVGTPMVAVLPFTSSGLAGDSEFFANGMHDDLLTQLAQLQSIRVISRTSVLEYRDTRLNIRQIGRELGVDAILEGGVQRVGDQIRINAQLIDVQTDEHLWAEQYDRKLIPTNIFAVQTEITRAITSALNTTLTQHDSTQLRVLPTENMAAYRAFHRAMEIRDAESLIDPECIAALEEAVTLDPEFIRAWAELAGSLSFKNFSQQDPDSIERIEIILKKIRALAPDSAEYLIAQAYFTYYVVKNYERSLQLINQAQILRPNDVTVIELKSWIQRRLGDFEGKVESTRLARNLDPRNPRWTTGLVGSLLTVHRYDEAIREIEATSNMDYRLSVFQNTLEQRKHRDPARRLEGLLDIQKEFNNYSNSQDLWRVYIANRDFVMAEKVMHSRQVYDTFDYALSLSGDSGSDMAQIISLWFLQDTARLNQLLLKTRTQLDEKRSTDGSFLQHRLYLIMAFVTAAEGNAPATERLIRTWRRAAVADLAELGNIRHHSCRALGMVAATAPAIECIRSGLVEPSAAMPFIEPFLPYYDSIREEPEFISLLADIQDKKL